MNFLTLGVVCGIFSGRGAAPEPELPLQIPDLLLWLDAGSGLYTDEAGTTPATAEGAAVALWRDRSGNNLHASQAESDNRPTLKTSAFQSSQAVGFAAASTQYLQIPTSALLNIQAPFTLVFLGSSNAGSQRTILSKDHAYYFDFEQKPRLNIQGGGQVTSTYNIGGGIGVSMTAFTLDTDLDRRFYHWNHLKETVADTRNPALYSGVACVGAYVQDATRLRPFDGDMLEVLFYQGVVSEADLYRLYQYFKAKHDPAGAWYRATVDPDDFKATVPDTALTIPTYDGSGQAVHPSVLYFPGGWNDFDYWKAMSPYPGGDASKENPSILASNDKLDWVEPEGLTNPIEPYPGPSGENSDPELVYDAATDTLYCVWRRLAEETLWCRRSTNGVTWTDKAVVISTPGEGDVLKSPSIIWVNGQLVMYTHDETLTKITRRTASSILGPWSEKQVTNMPSTPGHLCAAYADGVYYIFGGATNAILYTSDDGLNFEASVKGYINNKPAWMAAGAGVYRATVVKTETGFDMWASGATTDIPPVWSIGYFPLVMA